ncbi:MAG: ABC transporter substrate-binding protein [Oligoflexales bacterium]
MLEDYQLAFKQAGIQLQIIPYEIGAYEPEAILKVKKAMAGPSIASVGLNTSNYAVLAAPYLEGSNYTIVSSSATSSILEKYYPNLIATHQSNRRLAQHISNLINQEFPSAKISAVVAWDCAYCRDMYENLNQSIKNKTTLKKVIADSETIAPIIQEIMKNSPDVIYIPNFAVFSANLMNGFTEAGFRGTFIGGDSWGETNGRSLQSLTNGRPIQALTVRQRSQHFMTPSLAKLNQFLLENHNMPFSLMVPNIYESFASIFEVILKMGPPYTRERFQSVYRRYKHHQGKYLSFYTDPSLTINQNAFVVKLTSAGLSPYRIIESTKP